MAKKQPRIKDTSKTYPKIDGKKLAKALGAKLITSPKEKREFEKRYGLPNIFFQTPKKPRKSKKTILRIHCVKHPDFLADREPMTDCRACKTLYLTRKTHAARHGIKITKVSSSTSA